MHRNSWGSFTDKIGDVHWGNLLSVSLESVGVFWGQKIWNESYNEHSVITSLWKWNLFELHVDFLLKPMRWRVNHSHSLHIDQFCLSLSLSTAFSIEACERKIREQRKVQYTLKISLDSRLENVGNEHYTLKTLYNIWGIYFSGLSKNVLMIPDLSILQQGVTPYN